MPDVKLSQVMAFSSEDPNFPANNLLCSESYKKWKSKSAGEKEVSVLLKFENSSKIEAVHVGNEGSAFVEVLVGKLGDDVKDFQVLLPTSSFMSPVESRNGTNPSRVRLFEREKLSAAALDRPWDCARIICTQPFCRTAAYGLAFVRFRCPERAAPPPPGDQQPVRLGAFTLRPEAEDTLAAGGLFNRRSELTSGGGALKRDDRTDRVVPPRNPPGALQGSSSSDRPPQPSGHYQLKRESQQNKPSSDRSDKPAKAAARPSTSSPAASSAGRPNSAPGGAAATPKRSDAPPKRPNGSAQRPNTTAKRDQKEARDAGAGKAAAQNGAAGAGDASASRPPANAIYRPLKKLLSGVVFAMSGYQNPQRSNLREQGLRLGASYRPDWGPGCTHLICAFRNTPKFSAVRGRGKIVRGEWLTACVQQKRRLSWRRFATDPADGTRPDSGDEIWAEELRPPPPAGTSAPQTSAPADDDDEYGGSTDDEVDTDDEIRMAQESAARVSADTSGPVRQATSTSAPRPPPSPAAVSSGTPQRPASPSVARKRRSSPPPSAALPKRVAPATKRASSPVDSDEAYDADTDEDEPAAAGGARRPDTAGLAVPELPDFLRGRTFLLYGDVMSAETRRQASRVITAFGGKLEQYFGDSVKYVITEDTWDENFDEAASDHPDLMFVRPAWLEACTQKRKLVPLQSYLVTTSG